MRLWLPLAVIGWIALAGCSTGSVVQHPLPVVDGLDIPLPQQESPTVIVRGTVSWVSEHPGCPDFVTKSGQRFHLTGPLAQYLTEVARTGQRVPAQAVLVIGHIPDRADTQTVCGSSPPFVVDRIEAP